VTPSTDPIDNPRGERIAKRAACWAVLAFWVVAAVIGLGWQTVLFVTSISAALFITVFVILWLAVDAD
jgi:hypothetical protein